VPISLKEFMFNFSELPGGKPRRTDEPSFTPARPASEDVEKAFELSKVPVEEVQLAPESRVIVLSEPHSPGADRFRFLRMRLEVLKSTSKLKSILITSALPQDGKSTVALNLAAALAEGGRRSVLLLEADLHNATLLQRVNLKAKAGLAECLESGLDPLSALRHVEPLRCYLLPAGEAKGNPTDLFQLDSFRDLLQKLSPYFDWILIDTPPVAPITDPIIISQHADACLLVIRADRTPREAIEKSLELLGPKKVLGILFNGVEGLNELYSQYDGYYGKKKGSHR